MKALQTDFLGDDNIGLFSAANDRLCVMGSRLSDKKTADIKKVMGVEMLPVTISDSEIDGIFCAMNSNGIVLPKIVREREINIFKKVAGGLGMSVGVLGSNFTAVGNLILCNDKGAVFSSLLSSRDKKVVEDCLDVEAVNGTVAGLESVGSCGIATNKGCVLHRDASEDELNNLQDVLHVESDVGTANFGSPFVGSCAIANSNGVVAGDSTTGPEITRIMETLGLL